MVDYIMRREHKVRGHKGMGLERQSHNVSRSNRSGLKDIESFLRFSLESYHKCLEMELPERKC